MTTRAALYARFSTDLQREASIEDQLRICRAYAERLGASIVAEHQDAAISGQALGNRPGILQLLHGARRGDFDLVIAENTDRLTRSGADTWAIFEDLQALGVAIDTVNQGRIGRMHVGLSATMSAMLIEEIGRKTKRGLEGVVGQGRSAGGLCYGYRKTLKLDGRGEPIRGLREIDPDQAEVVRRIFRDYAAGLSPLAICGALNAEGVAGPSGRGWTVSTIAGNARRGNGVLHNELYNGVLVWGRATFVKDRHTGKRRARREVAAEPLRRDAPELRIVDEALWRAVRERHAQASHAGAGGRPEGARRPRRLLSGLMHCGCCGGAMTLSGAGGALRCSTRTRRGLEACDNARSPGYRGIEARVVAAIKGNLLHPAVIEAAVRELQAQAAQRAKDGRAVRLRIERELGEVERRANRLIDQVADGALDGAMVRDRLAGLEARRAELTAELRAEPAEVVDLHPGFASAYRGLIERLGRGLEEGDTIEDQEAREAFRRLISQVRISPLDVHGQVAIEIVGNLSPLLGMTEEGLTTTVGAGTRITRCRKAETVEIRLRA